MADNRKWLVKNQMGRIRGPYSTAEVLDQIQKGEFSGEEKVSLFPGGEWVVMSKDAVFYDKLLDILAGESQIDHRMRSSYESAAEEEDTKEIPLHPDEDLTTSLPEVEMEPTQRTKNKATPVGPPPPSKDDKDPSDLRKKPRKAEKFRAKKNDEAIELTDFGKTLKRLKFQGALGPAVLLVTALGLIWYLFSGETKDTSRIRLPRLSDATRALSAEQVEAKVKTMNAFFLDTFSAYHKALSGILPLVESGSPDPTSHALMCLTYLQLWPYAFQDTQDLQTVAVAVRRASRVDPTGPAGATCKIVDLLIKNRTEEAGRVTENYINEFGNHTAISEPFYFLLYLHSWILSDSKNYEVALGYLHSVQGSMKKWILPFVFEADLLFRLGKYNESAKRYRDVLQIVPSHRLARLELGLLEFRHFRHPEKGKELLLEAMESREPLPFTDEAKGYLGLAEIALYENDSDLALKHAKKCYELNPSNQACKDTVVKLGGKDELAGSKGMARQFVYEGDQFVKEGDCSSAQAFYKRAFEVSPRNGYAAMKAGKCLWQLSFSSEAIEWLNRAIQADSKLIEAYVTLADYHAQRYNFDGATKVLRRAGEVSKNNYEVLRGSALVELKRYNNDAAINFGKRALQIYEADAESMIIVAKAYLNQRNFPEAYSYASRAIESDLNNREGQVLYAQTLAGIKGSESGISYMTNLINKYPVVYEYRLGLGRIYYSDEQFGNAEVIFTQAARIDPKNKEARIELGRSLRSQGKLEAALAQFLEATIIDPSDATPVFEAGLLHLENKNPVQAAKQFERVLSINKLYPRTHYYIGKAFLMTGDNEKALEFALKERAINPLLPDSYLLAGAAHDRMGQATQCAQEYQKAIQVSKQPAIVYVQLGKCYLQMGNVDIAQKMLAQAQSIESGVPDIYKVLGQIYETTNEKRLAAESYEKYLALSPNAVDADQIRVKIMQLQ